MHQIPRLKLRDVAIDLAEEYQRAFNIAQEIEILSWLILPPWEQNTSDKGYRPPKEKQ